MKKFLVIFTVFAMAVMLSVAPVAASGNNHDNSNQQGQGQLQAQGQRQAQAQAQGQAQGQHQTATATSSASATNTASNVATNTANATGGNASNGSQSNSQSTSFTSPHEAPAFFVESAWPTAPCRVAFSGGGSWLTGGVGFGASKLDKDCAIEHAAQSFEALHEHRAAVRILCMTKAARLAKPEVCRQFPVEPQW